MIGGSPVPQVSAPILRPFYLEPHVAKIEDALAVFLNLLDITGGEFYKIAEKDREQGVLLLFKAPCHVVYATLGLTLK